jgi:hypothetical protein
VVQEWLSRAEDAAKPPLQVPFAFEDDAASEGEEAGSSGERRNLRAGSSVPGEGRSDEKDSPIEEAFPIAQMAELRISSHKAPGARDEASDASAEETLAEEAATKDGNDVVSAAVTVGEAVGDY